MTCRLTVSASRTKSKRVSQESKGAAPLARHALRVMQCPHWHAAGMGGGFPHSSYLGYSISPCHDNHLVAIRVVGFFDKMRKRQRCQYMGSRVHRRLVWPETSRGRGGSHAGGSEDINFPMGVGGLAGRPAYMRSQRSPCGGGGCGGAGVAHGGADRLYARPAFHGAGERAVGQGAGRGRRCGRPHRQGRRLPAPGHAVRRPGSGAGRGGKGSTCLAHRLSGQGDAALPRPGGGQHRASGHSGRSGGSVGPGPALPARQTGGGGTPCRGAVAQDRARACGLACGRARGGAGRMDRRRPESGHAGRFFHAARALCPGSGRIPLAAGARRQD